MQNSAAHRIEKIGLKTQPSVESNPRNDQVRIAARLDKSTRLIRESTVIGKMLTQSKEQLGKEFDHNKVRESIVAEKSMFKEGKEMHDLISNDAFFL